MNIQVIDHIDVSQLAADVSRKSREALWDKHTLRQDYPGTAHKSTRCIFLRGPRQLSMEDWFKDEPSENYETINEMPLVKHILLSVMAVVRIRTPPLVKTGHAMLVELAPGAGINWHVDEGEYAQKNVRFHLPLVTNPGCFLVSGAQVVHAEVGALTYFNNRILHSAVNLGQTRRIHLICDFRIEP